METDGNEEIDHKDIQLKILDDIVSVNSLLTVAVFVGLSLSSADRSALGIQPECLAGSGLPRKVVVLEIASFGCFVCSSFIAKSVKIYINLYASKNPKGGRFKRGRPFFLFVSIVASIAGVVLLTASVALLVEIKLGKLSCGTHDALTAFVPLCVSVVIGLVSYIATMFWAIFFFML